MKWLMVFLLLPAVAAAQCIAPADGMTIKESVTFCSSTYDVPNGILISGSNIVVDCGTAVLRGISGQSNTGIRIENADKITLKNCNIVTFDQGLFLKNVTSSVVQDNSFLKNRIGVRMLDSFENVIRDNNDKSFQLAVSAINSKFNVVMLGNKNIERAFCEVNACNEFREMNPCESGDFYCSKKCTPETDSDCGAPSAIVPTIVPSPPEKVVEKIVEEAKREVEKNVTAKKEVKPVQRKIPLATKLFIYIALYAITFIVLRMFKPWKS